MITGKQPNGSGQRKQNREACRGRFTVPPPIYQPYAFPYARFPPIRSYTRTYHFFLSLHTMHTFYRIFTDMCRFFATWSIQSIQEQTRSGSCHHRAT